MKILRLVSLELTDLWHRARAWGMNPLAPADIMRKQVIGRALLADKRRRLFLEDPARQ